MEPVNEKARAQEPPRRGAWALGRVGPQRGEAKSQPRKRPQGRPGQKPQEGDRRPAQRASAAPGPAQEAIESVIAAIRSRFGDDYIGLGACGIRFAAGT